MASFDYLDFVYINKLLEEFNTLFKDLYILKKCYDDQLVSNQQTATFKYETFYGVDCHHDGMDVRIIVSKIFSPHVSIERKIEFRNRQDVQNGRKIMEDLFNDVFTFSRDVK